VHLLVKKLGSWLMLLVLFPMGCWISGNPMATATAIPNPTPEQATITVIFDLGGGRTGFAASIYAQEVFSGKTFSHPYSAGSHGGVVLPSQPITFSVDAPGTYVFYGNLVNAPESYHYGATGCKSATNCASSDLLAVDVVPGGTYQVTISDRAAPVPTPYAPVTVPWHK
jgi:hypothetical protein